MRVLMKKYELISSLGWMFAGLIFLIGSTSFGLGELSEPGPGFFPFLMSLCLVFFSLAHFVGSLRKHHLSHTPTGQRFWPEMKYLTRIVLIVFLVLMYILAMNFVGFVPTTFLFMFILLKCIEPRRLRSVFLISAVTTGFTYAVFELWLRVNLPRGFLGF
jgi:putative tricarboxylic transport membrane protein